MNIKIIYQILRDIIWHSIKVAVNSLLHSLYAKHSAVDTLTLFLAALFHDSGKLFLNKAILFKESKLLKSEKRYINKHIFLSCRVAKFLRLSESVQFLIKNHHNDKAESSLLRVLRRCDITDALVSNRAYKKKLSNSQIKNILNKIL